ncbi:hypothetical protein [Chryseobacterium contaminans]|uniref:hypothetical protein n=1 Tax=Chryseobacterium contaminans TaxID=1423959 RepID=UPI00301A7E43
MSKGNGAAYDYRFKYKSEIMKNHQTENLFLVEGSNSQGWSLEKIPFQYDKNDIEYEVRMYVMSKQ